MTKHVLGMKSAMAYFIAVSSEISGQPPCRDGRQKIAISQRQHRPANCQANQIEVRWFQRTETISNLLWSGCRSHKRIWVVILILVGHTDVAGRKYLIAISLKKGGPGTQRSADCPADDFGTGVTLQPWLLA